MSPSALFPKLTTLGFSLLWLLTVVSVGAVLCAAEVPAAGAASHQGFGANTPGSTGQPVVHVTTLNDSGPGSLRDAVKQGNHTVIFDVSGTIALASLVKVKSAFLTLNGFSAPSPGITLTNAGLLISGANNVHDVIVQGLWVRGALGDGLSILDGAYNMEAQMLRRKDIASGPHALALNSKRREAQSQITHHTLIARNAIIGGTPYT